MIKHCCLPYLTCCQPEEALLDFNSNISDTYVNKSRVAKVDTYTYYYVTLHVGNMSAVSRLKRSSR